MYLSKQVTFLNVGFLKSWACFSLLYSQLTFAVLLDPEGPFGLEGFLFKTTKGLTFSKPTEDSKVLVLILGLSLLGLLGIKSPDVLEQPKSYFPFEGLKIRSLLVALPVFYFQQSCDFYKTSI